MLQEIAKGHGKKKALKNAVRRAEDASEDEGEDVEAKVLEVNDAEQS